MRHACVHDALIARMHSHYFIHYGVGVFIAGGELPSGHRPLTSGKLPSAQTGSLGVILVAFSGRTCVAFSGRTCVAFSGE